MPSFDVEDTIAAIASASGAAVRGIVRISGPDCAACLKHSFIASDDSYLNSRRYAVQVAGAIVLADDSRLPGELIFWPTNRSYTRQPAAEFHTFGSPVLLNSALSRICESGARLANPGEFTLRAFLSGRLDLAQAEAVLAIIDAEGESQLQGALAQLAGGLSGPLANARDQLTFVLAELEAGLDFIEEDIEFIDQSEIVVRLEEIKSTIESIARQIHGRNFESDAIRVGLFGQPNAGKSSLYNVLVGSQRAIVTNIPGTTTDFLLAKVDLNGQNFELVDTAGRERAAKSDMVSSKAQVKRAAMEASCQLKLWCVDGSCGLSDWEVDQLAAGDDDVIVVQTKSDLAPNLTQDEIRQHWQGHFVVTSAARKTGIEELQSLIRATAQQIDDLPAGIVGSTVLRAADSIRSAEESVQLALHAAQSNAGEEIVASELRQALDDLGQIVGTVYTDDILDVVFRQFCIGK